MKIKNWRMKKRIILLLCMGIFLLSSFSVSAQEAVNNDIIVDENAETVIEIESKEEMNILEYNGNIGVISSNARGLKKPEKVYDWNNGVYKISADAPYGGELYTEYDFTDFTTAELILTAASKYNQTTREDVQVIIYEDGAIFDKEITRFKVDAGYKKTYSLKRIKSTLSHLMVVHSILMGH